MSSSSSVRFYPILLILHTCGLYYDSNIILDFTTKLLINFTFFFIKNKSLKVFDFNINLS